MTQGEHVARGIVTILFPVESSEIWRVILVWSSVVAAVEAGVLARQIIPWSWGGYFFIFPPGGGNQSIERIVFETTDQRIPGTQLAPQCVGAKIRLRVIGNAAARGDILQPKNISCQIVPVGDILQGCALSLVAKRIGCGGGKSFGAQPGQPEGGRLIGVAGEKTIAI